MMTELKSTRITWLGHSTVQITTPRGASILIDPFIEQNPEYPKNYKLPDKLDLVLLTHAHFDHIADAVPVAKKSGANVVGMFELVQWIASKGVEKTTPMNLGGSFTFEDVTLTMVEAKHSSGIQDGDNFLYGGVPAGFILKIENTPVLYHAGDTALFGDMRLIAELYQPQIGMLPIGGHFTMDPEQAARAANYLRLKKVLPIHYGTFPPLKGTPDELEKHLSGSGIEVIRIKAGDEIS